MIKLVIIKRVTLILVIIITIIEGINSQIGQTVESQYSLVIPGGPARGAGTSLPAATPHPRTQGRSGLAQTPGVEPDASEFGKLYVHLTFEMISQITYYLIIIVLPFPM